MNTLLVLAVLLWTTPEPDPICDEVYYTQAQDVDEKEAKGLDDDIYIVCYLSLTPYPEPQGVLKEKIYVF